MTAYAQPLDCAFMRVCKSVMVRQSGEHFARIVLQEDIDDVFDMCLSTFKGALNARVSTASKTMEKESHFDAVWRDLFPEHGR